MVTQQREPCQSSLSAPQSLASFPIAPTDIEHVDDCREDGAVSSTSKSNQPPPLHAPLHHPSRMLSSSSAIVTEDNKTEENSIGYEEEEELVEEKQKQRSANEVVVDAELLTSSSSDEDDMPMFSRLRRVLTTDLPDQNGVHHSFDRDRNNYSCSSSSSSSRQMMMTTTTVEKETAPDEEEGGTIQSSRVTDDVNSPADIQSQNNMSSNNAEKKQMEDTAEKEITESEVVHFEDKSDEPNRSTFDMNNGGHVVVKEQFEANDEQQVVAAAQAGRKDEGNVLVLAHNKEVMKNEVAVVVGAEPKPQFRVVDDNESHHHSSSYYGGGDKAAAQIILPTATQNEDDENSDTIKDFRPEIDVDTDFFSSGNDDDEDDNENGGEGEEVGHSAVVDRAAPWEERLQNSTEVAAAEPMEPMSDELESRHIEENDSSLGSTEDSKHLEEQCPKKNDAKADAEPMSK